MGAPLGETMVSQHLQTAHKAEFQGEITGGSNSKFLSVIFISVSFNFSELEIKGRGWSESDRKVQRVGDGG